MFPSLQLTDSGRAIIVNAMYGGSVVFTKIGAGNGDMPSEINKLTDLVNPIRTVGISEMKIGDGCVTLTAVIDNANLTDGFWWKEIGIYAKNISGEEVLYAYANAEDYADYIPAYASASYLRTTMNITVMVGDAENISAIISEYVGYVTTETFESHAKNTTNPHKVTASQVGLGKVPNVSTNDQTPTYADATTLETLSSGEKLGTAFGKIKLAITNIIKHLADNDNPHKVTAEKIKAADKSHSHSTNDITSGTLSVNRGGTGVESYEKLGKKLYYTGAYVGDGKADRIIDIGFEPQAVLLFGGCVNSDFSAFAIMDRHYLKKEDGHVDWISGNCVLGTTDNGFMVNYSESNGINSNVPGNYYMYIAFR